jgi:hypothetical protein
MPKFDKTGPRGQGSKTGRGRGLCNQNKKDVDNPSSDSILNRPFGRGLRRLLGFGRVKRT